MRKWIKFIITLVVITFINTFVLLVYNYNVVPKVKSISLLDYNANTNTLKIEIKKQKGFIYDFAFDCLIQSDNHLLKEIGKNNSCVIEIPIDKDYKIHLENIYKRSEDFSLLDYIDNKLDFHFGFTKTYLAVGQTKEITYEETYIVPIDTIYEFYSLDENIATVEEGKIVAKSVGKTYIKAKGSKETIEVIVTDLIGDYYLSPTKKELLPCNVYTAEEADMLDEILDYYIKEAGESTRAGVVAAGRFLTLQFKYRVPYFYENGRTNDSGVHKADGEGRYYKKGMYLNENKFASILYTYADKAIWGCPLKNGQSNPKYGFIPGKKMPNGLDCSGFVSWALVNGGFDPGDVGAGENEGIYQLTDTGEFTALTKDLALSGKIKTGDLFNFWGHIALIIGQDEDNYYVAESLPHLGGVIAKTYSKKTVANTFEFVVFMDSFYKNDGNLTDYWK